MEDSTKLTIILHYRRGHWAQMSNCALQGNTYELQRYKEGFFLIKIFVDDSTELTIIWYYRKGHWPQYLTAQSRETLMI